MSLLAINSNDIALQDVCQRCRCCTTDWESCWNGCEEGLIDEYEDDPINYAPGEEYRKCTVCEGKGGWVMCIGRCNENGAHEAQR